MKHFYLAHYDANGKPLGKNWQSHTNNTDVTVTMKSAEGSVEEVEALIDFSRWMPINPPN
jgi:hypothetical protein